MKRVLIKTTFILTLTVLSIVTTLNYTSPSKGIDPYFTIVAKVHGGGFIGDLYNLERQHLLEIGISMDIIICDWPTFVGELVSFHDYDLVSLGFSGGRGDPDFSGIYNENGSLNYSGYHTSMDWNETLGTGTNEWYIHQGTLIMPPDSQQRIQHYWKWEEHLMDKILPCLPLFGAKYFSVQWENLNGYNYSEGIIQSWGKMSFNGTHSGQIDTTELVTADAAWSNLNPLFLDDTSSRLICQAIMDPLIWYDNDLQAWPHLAESYTMINDTHLQIVCREGIKWQNDPDGLFPDEYFDARDVYFTLFSLKNFSNEQYEYEWIKDMQIIDSKTIDIFIDGNPSTLENEPYTFFLNSLNIEMLPEHYLNATQFADGITPDITHSNWDIFETEAFGTGLFEISSYTEGYETVLTVNSDCWKLDPSVDKSNMEFKDRFGYFTGGINTWRVKVIYDYQTSLNEFEDGNIDLHDLMGTGYGDDYYNNSLYVIQEKQIFSFMFTGFNMRLNRPVIGNTEPCEKDSTITKGLAVRKAIAYAINREEILNIIFKENTRFICHHPIYPNMGIWLNPNIIRYNHDLELANYYMALAGYSQTTPEAFIGYFDFSFFLGSIILTVIFIGIRKKKNEI